MEAEGRTEDDVRVILRVIVEPRTVPIHRRRACPSEKQQPVAPCSGERKEEPEEETTLGFLLGSGPAKRSFDSLRSSR
jgi:hypothetical protein